MKLEPVAWDVRINGDSTVTAIKRRADEWRNVLGGEVIPLYAIPDGYVVVPLTDEIAAAMIAAKAES